MDEEIEYRTGYFWSGGIFYEAATPIKKDGVSSLIESSYFKNFHNEKGPAICWNCGHMAWYRFGKVHRTGGPAVKYSSKSEEWYNNGKLHRIDGPASTNKINGIPIYYWAINNKDVTFKVEQFLKLTGYTIPLSEEEQLQLLLFIE